METSTLNLIKLLSESRRIIKTKPRHFLALSFLFIVPFSIATALYPILQSPFPEAILKSFLSLLGFGPQQAADQVFTIPTNTLLLALAYGLFTFVFSICAIISITYSVIHGFTGQPVKLKSAIKSIATNFFPLFGTSLLAQTIATSIAILFVVVFAFFITGARLLGFQIEFSSPYFILLCSVMGIPLFLIVIYLQVIWTLLCVVVVAEKTWGFEALKRSSSLIKGRRWLALSLTLLFAFCWGLVSWSLNYSLPGVDLDGSSTSTSTTVTHHEWKCLVFRLVVLILLNLAVQTLLLLYNMVANTVLYVYSNKAFAVHGDKEFAGEYISLPTEDEKAPSVVSSKLDGSEV